MGWLRAAIGLAGEMAGAPGGLRSRRLRGRLALVFSRPAPLVVADVEAGLIAAGGVEASDEPRRPGGSGSRVSIWAEPGFREPEAGFEKNRGSGANKGGARISWGQKPSWAKRSLTAP